MSIKINRLEEGHNSYPLVCRRPAETVSFQRRQICYRWGTPAYWSLVTRSSMFYLYEFCLKKVKVNRWLLYYCFGKMEKHQAIVFSCWYEPRSFTNTRNNSSMISIICPKLHMSQVTYIGNFNMVLCIHAVNEWRHIWILEC